MSVESISSINEYDTWPKVLKYNFEKYGDRHNAMRYKHLGIWQPYTWKDYYMNVKYLALGLASLGFKEGDKLLIVGDNSPEWYFAELAAQCNRGICAGLYSDLTASELKYIAVNSEASFAIVEDQEQVDKFLNIKASLPKLKKIVYWRYKGLANYNDEILTGHKHLMDLGREFERVYPGYFEDNIAHGKADDICAIVYTSGTTRESPKGAVHSYQSIRHGSEYYLHLDPWRENDNVVSYLPPAWITEQWLSFGCHLLSASVSNFSEGAETQMQDIREIAPSMVFYSTRLWERQAGKVQAKIKTSSGFKKAAYGLFMPLGYKFADARLKKRNLAWYEKIQQVFADYLLFRPIRDSLGLPNARICCTAGSTLSADAHRFFHALNVPLKSLYGSTEGGALTGAKNEDIRPDTVGTLNRGTEARIMNNGEIATRQPGVFLGYYNEPARTAKVLRNGWFYTGDSGRLEDDGHLIFIDRVSDIIRLASGEQVAPQEIESRLKFSPYIKDAWIVAGPSGSYVSVIIIIDMDNVGPWADKKQVTYTTFNDLSQKPEVYGLIRQEIAAVSSTLAPASRIKKFANLHKEFDPDESELTRTRKLKRNFVAERYGNLINAIYEGKTSIPIEAQVTYQDGRTANIKTAVSIKSVEEAGQ
jgi:long-chain acyl-CoA synthetase